MGFAYLLVDSPTIFVDLPTLFIDLPTLLVRKERERDILIQVLTITLRDAMEENPTNVEDEYLFTL